VTNFVSAVVERLPASHRALVVIADDGSRREISFGEVAHRSACLASTLAHLGVRRGDVVLTLIGNTPDWVFSMLACFRLGAVVLPCNEQLRSKDLAFRISMTNPAAIVCHRRNRDQLDGAKPTCPVLSVPDESLYGDPGNRREAPASTPAEHPALITFTSGSSGPPKAVVHAHRYLFGQAVQATHWIGARPGDLVWCTATSGWSKSARNGFIAPWLCGAAGLLHDARFDPEDRLAVLARERVGVLCMSPTEYRVIAKRAGLQRLGHVHRLLAAGEALNEEVLGVWREATGLDIADGYGQTETGQLTGARPGEPTRPGSMGRALPGIKLWVDGGELVADPRTIPTFFLGYLESDPPDTTVPWRTGDQVTQDDAGYFRFVGRADDVIISAGYRIGPFEVESALIAHEAVADAAVVAAPDEERGSIVRAVVVLREGYEPSSTLVGALQEHVRQTTAPYKYPRMVEFADRLPRTSTGKVWRAALRS
jgi:acyl-coenzyme A synthetase/AMP-(fatty) acid ligase